MLSALLSTRLLILEKPKEIIGKDSSLIIENYA